MTLLERHVAQNSAQPKGFYYRDLEMRFLVHQFLPFSGDESQRCRFEERLHVFEDPDEEVLEKDSLPPPALMLGAASVNVGQHVGENR